MAERQVQIWCWNNANLVIGPDAVIAEGASTEAIFQLGLANAGVISLLNRGTVTADYGLVRSFSGTTTIINEGTMIAGAAGIICYNGPSAARVTNHGLITVTGSNSEDGDSGNGVLFAFQNGAILNNTGTIEVYAFGKSGVVFGSFSALGTLTNSGTIWSRDGAAVSGGGNVTIDNTGTLARGTSGIVVQLGSGNDTVVNTGRIFGDIDMSEGNDTLAARDGIVEGDVLAGIGNDVLDLRGGRVTGSVSGGGGDDIYRVSDATLVLVEAAAGGTDLVESTVAFALGAEFENLTLLGANNIAGAGNGLVNVIQGNAGENRLTGGAGNDTLSGAEGSDILRGGRGNDRLNGDDGDDVLAGGEGNDNLNGGDEDDRLTGGVGRDVMTGGNDDDTFVFNRLTDTGTTVATADQITDFAPGRDIIDLRGIDAITTNAVADNAFVYIGTAAFSNVAGQLRWSTTSGVTTIEMDVNGDSVADAAIRLTNGVSLTAGDFVL
jgi:Ca2+-binding RTX toxin-like protein